MKVKASILIHLDFLSILKKIKEIVTEKESFNPYSPGFSIYLEMSRIDRVIEEIYSIDDGSNHSVAFQWGFDTVANLKGSGYENLIRIIDRLNDGGEDEAFVRFILNQVLPGDKIEALALELLKNETSYKSILWPY